MNVNNSYCLLLKLYVNPKKQLEYQNNNTKLLHHGLIQSRADLGSVVRRPKSAIHWIARLRFGIYKLEFLISIVGVQIRRFTALRLVLRRLHWWIAYPGFVQPPPVNSEVDKAPWGCVRRHNPSPQTKSTSPKTVP